MMMGQVAWRCELQTQRWGRVMQLLKDEVRWGGALRQRKP